MNRYAGLILFYVCVCIINMPSHVRFFEKKKKKNHVKTAILYLYFIVSIFILFLLFLQIYETFY